MNKPCWFRVGETWYRGQIHGWVMSEVIVYGIIEDSSGTLHKINMCFIRFKEPGLAIQGESNAGPTQTSEMPTPVKLTQPTSPFTLAGGLSQAETIALIS